MGVSTQQNHNEVGVLLLVTQPSCQRAIGKQPVLHPGAREYWREYWRGCTLIARDSWKWCSCIITALYLLMNGFGSQWWSPLAALPVIMDCEEEEQGASTLCWTTSEFQMSCLDSVCSVEQLPSWQKCSPHGGKVRGWKEASFRLALIYRFSNSYSSAVLWHIWYTIT